MDGGEALVPCMQCADMIPETLEDGVRGMIYAGDQDLICNWLGNLRWVDALPWGGAADWAATDDCEWHVDGEPAGRIRQSGTLSFVKVYNAGHMVRLLRLSRAVMSQDISPKGGSRGVLTLSVRKCCT